MPVQCPECLSENADNANFCNQCGTRLHLRRSGEPSRASRQRRNMTLAALLACLFLAAGLYLYSLDNPGQQAVPPAPAPVEETADTKPPAQQEAPVRLAEKAAPEPATQPPPPAAREEPAARVEEERLPDSGYVSVVDGWGYVYAEIPSVVVDYGWIALPTKGVVGGSLRFRSLSGREAAFAGGLWQQGDNVGLWQLENDKDFTGAPLAAWDPTRELTWAALDGSVGQEAVPVAGVEAQGFFLHASLPDSFKGPALLLQDAKVVGWSFGEALPGAYLWNGALDTVQVYEATVTDFYNQTFAGGREEQFAYGLAMDEHIPVVTRLAVFADAFSLPPKLLEADTPQRLRKVEIIPYLRYLAGQIHNRREATETVRLYPASLLQEIADPQFSATIARLAVDGIGHQYAIRLLSEIVPFFRQFPAARVAELQALHLRLFLELINTYLKEDQLVQARKIFDDAVRFYAEDAGLYLAGVELAIAGEDWRSAERLLNARAYPPRLLEKEKLLRASIAALKAREGKIVIEFTPGYSVIPTSAVLGGLLRQNFLVDTGATFVTIPSSTASQLGLQVTDASPRQVIFTAVGTFTAPEVLLPSIELGGWVVDNVRALVLDIPSHSNTGLLGLNYLNRFQMDLDAENGILLLSPK